MQRITTNTRAVDLHGAGKDGFAGNGPPNATELEPAWFNNVQEEIANVIEGQGEVLDGLVLNQLKSVLDDYAFNNPSIGAGGTLTIDGTLNITGTGVLTADVGSTCTFNGNVLVGGTGSFTVNCDADFMNNVILGQNAGDSITAKGVVEFVNGATIASGQSISGADATTSVVVGTVDTADENGVVATGELQFYSDTSPSSTTGVMQFDGRSLTIGLSSLARKVSVPYEDYVAGPTSTVNAIADTGASVTILLATGDKVMVEMDYEAKNTATTNNVNVRIEVDNGGGFVTIGSTEPHAPVKANVYFSVRRVVEYTASATSPHTFKARFGATGDTSTVQNTRMLIRRSN